MPARSRPRHAARHAKPGRSAPPLLPVLLALALSGGVGGLALASAGGSAATSAALATSALALHPTPAGGGAAAARSSSTASSPSADVLAPTESALLRASRDRAPSPAPVVETPPPPPPAPVLPGCEGAPETGHANGRIPASALCRLPGTTGHALRADAARAFVQLSAAHEAERGTPLCVTDTYRSYEAQVKLRWAKRGLAAPPGTSNHGEGIAVDLCGGVESFGTPAHRWMQAHAGRFGWVHPSWAGPRGKRPEPWHWEYRG